ncbi:rRNA maturation RNase YbeY [Petroclostridium sp. X23]|uniref:rRNA maturation RNase YbeY n=1 Tax=Petroclostridium sp. X23 TaxID=3045146 RepID=UPI0024ACF69C|nr:rRNA maturation RNase YbeY [Petroclostridium sp. X23]WHH59577.1 rRNA maturation RNase YbeY [Petroclostridium sp. X23]
MSKAEIIIENNQQNIELDSELEALICGAVKAVLKFEVFDKDVEVSVTLVDNEQIKEINKEFRQKDTVTDVLSFPMLNFDENHNVIAEYNIGDYNHDDELLLLGDIVISLETAVAQAEEYGHSFAREVGFLTVHSMFHLLGYDHEEENEAQVMRTKEEQVLNDLGLMR